MTRSSLHIVRLLSLCLGLWSCVPSNEPPAFREVGLASDFTSNDTAVSFKGAISAPAGGIHLDFKVSGNGLDQTERFQLVGAAPAATSTYWDLAADSRLRLVNRSAPTGSYQLVLIAVDADGISDSIRIPFSVASTGQLLEPWYWLEINLSLAASSGLNLESLRIVSRTDPAAKDATFFLAYQHSSSSASGLSWLALVPPALLDPPLSDAAARSDARFYISDKIDTTGSPAQVRAFLQTKSPLEETAGLTNQHTIFLTTKSGLIGRFVVDSMFVSKDKGFLRLVGAYSKPY